MSIKKKLGLGAASAVIGLSLVVGGTWAAFNDVAKINNHFAAGTLDLVVGQNASSQPINFDLSKMKPGDSVRRIFKLNNAGTLAIKEVLLTTTAANFVDGTLPNTQKEFLSQFRVDFMQVSDESNANYPLTEANKVRGNLTLADLVYGPYADKIKPEYLGTDGKLNLAPLTAANNAYRGIPVQPVDSDLVSIMITFVNDEEKDAVTNEYVQNKYQGDEIDFFFNLEATQWDGVNVDTPNGNGAINNGVQGSADGETMPNPITVPRGVEPLTPAVND